MNRIAELEEELKTLRAAEEKADRERRDAVKPIYRFTFTPTPDGDVKNWMGIRPGSGVRAFTLRGTVTNDAELEAVGRHSDKLDGAMNYLVNTELSPHRIIKADGGGTIYIGNGWGSKDGDEERTYAAIEDFLAQNPNGGDITSIIRSQKRFQ